MFYPPYRPEEFSLQRAIRSLARHGRQTIADLKKRAEDDAQQSRLRQLDASWQRLERKSSQPAINPAQVYELAREAQEAHYQLTRYLNEVSAARSARIQQQEESPSPEKTVPLTEEKVPLRPVPIGKHKLPPLPYPYDALEPYIDQKTMYLHHNEHHKSYVDGLNKAEIMMARARKTGDFSLIKHWEREAAFNGAGHYLHSIFWEIMSPKGGGEPQGEIRKAINRYFGSFASFKKHFSAAAEKVEGGGWAILVWSPRAHHLEILQAEKPKICPSKTPFRFSYSTYGNMLTTSNTPTNGKHILPRGGMWLTGLR